MSNFASGGWEQRISRIRASIRRKLRLARALPGVEADDIVNEAVANALRAGTRPRGSPTAWLHKIAHHVLIDRRRSAERRMGAPGPPDEPNSWERERDEIAVRRRSPERPARAEDLPDRAPSPSMQARSKELWERVGALPERERAVIQLLYLDGYDTEEVAERLATTPGAVYGIQFRALRRLERNAGADDAAL
jgi:RNA polymerase sigma factor (sigma-70 family)